MPSLDILNDDAFSVSTLTASVNNIEPVPSILGDSGLFEEEGVSTTTIQVETKDSVLSLVTASQRGGPGHSTSDGKRKLIPFNLVHLKQPGLILADSIQNKRAFGKESEVEMIETVVLKELARLKKNNDATIEFQRIGAIKGQILDSDGTTVLEDIYDRFGLTQPSQNIAFGTAATNIKELIVKAKRARAKKLGGGLVTQWVCRCSASFFDILVSHAEIEKAYDRWQDSEALRSDMSDDFKYAGVTFSVYDASVGSTDFIAPGEAYMYPVGVPEMFITRFGPADYMETVDTDGLPYYAKQERMKFDRGVELELQSNVLSLCTMPLGVQKFKAT